jgi:hypothetical protein
VPGDNKSAIVWFSGSIRKPGGNYGMIHGMGYYAGGNTITRFSINTNSTMDGNVVWERIA